jgi:hypothetical protein
MTFYFPIFLTVLFAIFQSCFCKKGKLPHTIILAFSFTMLINFVFMDYTFLVYMIFGNFFFYLMVVVTYFTRPQY